MSNIMDFSYFLRNFSTPIYLILSKMSPYYEVTIVKLFPANHGSLSVLSSRVLQILFNIKKNKY